MAYREIGAGRPLALLHSAFLSHKEWEPAVEQLADRFRVVLPDLPLHGDSEDRWRHPYTLDWFAEVFGGFAAEVLGPRPLLAGHDAGAEIIGGRWKRAAAARRECGRGGCRGPQKAHSAPANEDAGTRIPQIIRT